MLELLQHLASLDVEDLERDVRGGPRVDEQHDARRDLDLLNPRILHLVQQRVIRQVPHLVRFGRRRVRQHLGVDVVKLHKPGPPQRLGLKERKAGVGLPARNVLQRRRPAPQRRKVVRPIHRHSNDRLVDLVVKQRPHNLGRRDVEVAHPRHRVCPTIWRETPMRHFALFLLGASPPCPCSYKPAYPPPLPTLATPHHHTGQTAHRHTPFPSFPPLVFLFNPTAPAVGRLGGGGRWARARARHDEPTGQGGGGPRKTARTSVESGADTMAGKGENELARSNNLCHPRAFAEEGELDLGRLRVVRVQGALQGEARERRTLGRLLDPPSCITHQLALHDVPHDYAGGTGIQLPSAPASVVSHGGESRVGGDGGGRRHGWSLAVTGRLAAATGNRLDPGRNLSIERCDDVLIARCGLLARLPSPLPLPTSTSSAG